MIRTRILALGVLFALAAPLADPAAAQTPALRASVTVTGDVVRIGDLIDNAGAVAEVPIFRSPALGTPPTGGATRPHQLIDLDPRGLTEAIATRASRTIAAQDIAARISQALSGHFGMGEARNVTVYFDRDIR